MLLALFLFKSSICACTLGCSRVGVRDCFCCCFVNCCCCIDCGSSCRGRCRCGNLDFAARDSHVSFVIVKDNVIVVRLIVANVYTAFVIVLVVVFVVVHVLVVCSG